MIIQFGNAPTSNAMLDFLKNSSAYKVTVNEFGDRKDSGLPHDKIVKTYPNEFIDAVIKNLEKKSDKTYLKVYQQADAVTEDFKTKFLNQ
ncbi:MAG: hypothetical protein U5K00_18140 [Melioribacteraceae bacterium]|nr:hypothetical protein [Melioribacteraceae bacterium]